jgi:hypothetical protein
MANIYPNQTTGSFCTWLLANSLIRLTAPRKIQVQNVQSAANTGGYVTQLYFEEFVQYTNRFYQEWQQYINGQPITPMPSGYDALTTAWLTHVTSPAQQTIYAVDAFFKQLRADGNLAIDVLYLFAQDNQTNSNVSLFNPATYTALPVGTPTWNANLGYTTNGISSYINTEFNLATNGVNYTQNNAMITHYARNAVAGTTGVDWGSYDGTNIAEGFSNYTGYGVGGYLNSLTVFNATDANTQGCFSYNRPSSSTVNVTVNGTQILSASDTATGLANDKCYIGCRNASGTAALFKAQQYTLWMAAAGSLNMVTLNSAINLLMTNIGAHY